MFDDLKKKYEQLFNIDYTQVPRGTDGLPIWSTEITSTSLNRDYWLKLYAGMALQGMWASPKFDVIAEFSDTSKTIKQMAQALVDEMFKDES